MIGKGGVENEREEKILHECGGLSGSPSRVVPAQDP